MKSKNWNQLVSKEDDKYVNVKLWINYCVSGNILFELLTFFQERF